VRDLTLNETFDAYGRLIQMLGTTTPPAVGKGFGLAYEAPATELVAAGSTEVWRIFNTTADTHPIHFHLVNVQVLSRQPFKLSSGSLFTPTGVAVGPQPNELGWKETVRMNTGEVTSVLMKFDLPTGLPFTVPTSPRTGGNEYVWHCHILEHEEHDMMRPLVVF
jgi:spore coat protein A